MRPISSPQRWFAATVLMLASSSLTMGQEGVVRMSDADTRPGVVKMSAARQPAIRQTAYSATQRFAGHSMASAAYGYQFQNQAPVPFAQNVYQPTNPCHMTGAGGYAGQVYPTMQSASYTPGGHSFACDCQGQFGQGGWQSCGQESCGQEGCNSNDCRVGRRQLKGQGCQSCDDCFYGDGYNERMVTLFAKAVPKDCCNNQCWGRRWWRGQQENYLARNQRLSNCLFGWLVPSGCCGQGCPPIGKYCMTYADDPGYGDPRDGGAAYGVQGYGVPMTVPLAPNVRQSYNYSWGTPSSRITPLGNYSGTGGGPQQLYHQSW